MTGYHRHKGRRTSLARTNTFTSPRQGTSRSPCLDKVPLDLKYTDYPSLSDPDSTFQTLSNTQGSRDGIGPTSSLSRLS